MSVCCVGIGVGRVCGEGVWGGCVDSVCVEEGVWGGCVESMWRRQQGQVCATIKLGIN